MGNFSSSVNKVLAPTEHVPASLDASVLVSKLPSLLASNLPDKEIEVAFYSLLALLSKTSMEDLTATVKDILVHFGENETERSALKLRLLMTLYNVLETNHPARYHVFLTVAAFTTRIGQVDIFLPQIAHIQERFKEWNSTEQEQAHFYLQISKLLKQANQRKEHWDAVEKYLEHAKNSADETVVVGFVRHCIASPVFYDFERVYGLAALDGVKTQVIGQLLSIFYNGSLSDCLQFVKKHEAEFGSLGLKEDKVVAKFKLIILASEAANYLHTPIDYQTAADSIQVSTHELEQYLVDGVRAGLIDVRMDQLEHRITFHRAHYRTFGQQEWELILSRLTAWKENCQGVLQVIHQAKPKKVV